MGDSQFAGTEALMTGLVDNWPELLRPHRKKFTLGMTVFMCLLGLPMITRGGIYVFQLMDFYAALLAEIKYNAARAGELKDVELSLLDPPAPEAVPGSAEKRS